MLLSVMKPKRFSLFLALATLISLVGGSLYLDNPAFAQSSWAWYKTDLHVHSVLSSDAFDDLGIQSQVAKSLGYNALFLTDHNLASSFPISGLTANNMVFEDSYTHWTAGTYGSQTSTTNALASTPVHTGAKSLHLVSTASGSGETYVWTKRGPNFRSGDIILKFSVYPTRIDPGSGVYISASIGGDVTVQSPDGYTTSSGVISPGKSIVLIWQLGLARQSSSDPNSRVLTFPLTYTLNTWNNYTINISSALASIPSTELPLDYNGVTYLKMAAAGNSGTANAYFDTYSITPSAPVPPADEFVYRTSIIHTYDTSTFKIFPSVEMGIGKHAQRFNFGITNPSQFVSYANGIDGILPAQQSGYPAMLNHPGSNGGVSNQEATSTQGEGADLMEVRQQGWINDWDAILQQGVQLLGTGTTDTHRVFSGSSYATYVYAPMLSFDSLVHSIFEGRTYIAMGGFGNQSRVIFNLDSGSQEPYPARYPVYVPSTRSSVNVHLSVNGGLQSGYTVKWIRNGALLATNNIASASYETTKTISLGGAWTYVRAEIRDSSGTLKALTQPLVFVTVPGLPADKSYHIDSVTTANGRQYTKLFVKGITASGWDAAGQVLTLTLKNPANALVDMRLPTSLAPQSVQVDSVLIPVADSLTTFQAASGSMWYYNGTGGLLYLKVLQATDISNVSISFANTGTSTNTPTNTPTLTPTPTQTSTPTITSTPTATQTPTPTATSSSTNTPPSVGVGTYDDANAAWSYTGSWTSYLGSGPMNNTMHYTNVQNASASLTFTGTGFTVYFAYYPNRGDVEVWIDGVLNTTFSQYGSTLAWQQSWTLPTSLSNGTHTVQFKNPNASTATYIDIDAITVIAPVGPGTYDDANAAWGYTGSWTTYSGSGPMNNTMHYTNVQNASASLTFTGTGFTVYFAYYPNRGNVEVWIDGVLNTTFSQYGSTLAWQQSWTLPTSLSNGTHTVQFKNSNASTATYIDIDAITILQPVTAGTYDDANAAWSYTGSWTSYLGSGPMNNTMHYTNVQNASASLTFTGTGFSVYFAYYPNRGDVEVWIDGVLNTTFSQYGSTLAWQQSWTLPTSLSNGTHTVQFKNPNASTATYIDIDAIAIQ